MCICYIDGAEVMDHENGALSQIQNSRTYLYSLLPSLLYIWNNKKEEFKTLIILFFSVSTYNIIGIGNPIN